MDNIFASESKSCIIKAMFEGIKAVAFDIDGTLYPSWKLYARMWLYILCHLRFYVCYGLVRRKLHRTAPLADFYEYQARLYAEIAHVSREEAKHIINDVCYEGAKRYLLKVMPYPHVVECIRSFKAAGLKIAILSDFPPEQKGDIWGIRQLCDVCIGSEQSGALKPSVYPFGILCLKLGLPANSILYVGNSIKYDILGAKNAGMKTAFLMRGLRGAFNKKFAKADISFRNYRQLEKIVIG